VGYDAVLFSWYFLKFLRFIIASSWSSSLVGLPDPEDEGMTVLKNLGNY
jgi:hypothetical protein